MGNIAKTTINISDRDINVRTDKGWVKVTHIHKTFKFRKYLVLFESGREVECADRHCFILSDGQERITEMLEIGDIVHSEEGEDVIFDIFDTGELEEMYDITLEHHHKYFTNGILSHNSNFMANMISRQVLHGKNICLASLEMSEDMFAQRFDGIYSKLDINRFYFNEKLKKQLVKSLKDVKATPNRGNLYIKSFPTGKASVNDFRIWVRELQLRDIKIDGFYFDYLNLMRPETFKGDGGNTNSIMKAISEETRAMGFEFDVPMISVTQLNRSGMFMDLSEVEFTSISEGISTAATADFAMIMGSNDEHMVYQNEVHYKIVKNRLGGRVGELDKFYYDAKSLKMYDSSELELWMSDIKHSGDDRTPKSQSEVEEKPKRSRKKKE